MKVQQVKEVKPVAHDPVFLNTVWGAVAVYGHELMSKKDLVILGHCLALPDFSLENGDHGVRMVIFRDDNRPVEMRRKKNKDGKYDMIKVPLMASCVPDSQSIVVNLEQTFIVSAEETEAEGEHSSIRACFHRNLILNYLHEIHHMERLHKEGMAEVDDATKAELENDAQEWALQQLFALAKSVDIEPAHHAESSYLSNALMAMLMEEKDKWSSRQRHMLENNIMYDFPAEKDKHEGLTLMSFKGICLLMSGDDADDPAWKKETILNAGVSSAELPNEIDRVMGTAGYQQGSMEDAELLEVPDPGWEGVAVNYEEEYGGYDDGYQPQPQFQSDVPFTTQGTQTYQQVQQPVNTQSVMSTFPVAGQPMPQYQQQQQAQQAPQYQQAEQVTPAVKVYPDTGLTPEQTRDVVFGVFHKIYQHVFTHCGRMLNSDMGFQNPEAVTKIPVMLTEQEKAVVVKCDCLDANGRWCPNMPTVEGIRGFIMKNTKLPAYKIYINNGGFEAIRLLLPQNPAKRDGNGYSKPAVAARGGSCIMYVMEGLDKGNYNDKSKFYFKCIDNVWQYC